MGITRKQFLRRAEARENEGWMAGLTGKGYSDNKETLSYEWGRAVRAALRWRKESCDSRYEYQFGKDDFERLIEAAVTKNLLKHK